MLVSPAELVGVAKATITECSVTDVNSCIASETLLIDVREPAEYHKGKIPGAVHLPRGLLEFEIHKLVEHYRADENQPDAERAIVVYCGTGGRSALAAQTLEAMGYRNVRSMAGGIVAWNAAHLPVETAA
jgi:rhodanese-related sulfurtransferase